MMDEQKQQTENEEHKCDGSCEHDTNTENAPEPEKIIQMLENLLQQAESKVEASTKRNEALVKAFHELRQEQELSNGRHKKALEDSAKYACADFAKVLVIAMDSFNMAMELTRSMPTVYLGLKMAYDTLEQEMKKYGIIKMYCELGVMPNPSLHQVIGEVESEYEPGTIAQVVQNGYIIHDRILRHSSINTSKGKAK